MSRVSAFLVSTGWICCQTLLARARTHTHTHTHTYTHTCIHTDTQTHTCPCYLWRRRWHVWSWAELCCSGVHAGCTPAAATSTLCIHRGPGEQAGKRLTPFLVRRAAAGILQGVQGLHSCKEMASLLQEWLKSAVSSFTVQCLCFTKDDLHSCYGRVDVGRRLWDMQLGVSFNSNSVLLNLFPPSPSLCDRCMPWRRSVFLPKHPSHWTSSINYRESQGSRWISVVLAVHSWYLSVEHSSVEHSGNAWAQVCYLQVFFLPFLIRCMQTFQRDYGDLECKHHVNFVTLCFAE